MWKILAVFGFYAFLTSPVSVGSNVIKNKIIGNPEVACKEDGIVFEMETENAFQGQLYARNEYHNAKCRANFDQQNGIAVLKGIFRLNFNDCGMRRQRMVNPASGMTYSVTMIVQFHKTFVTAADKAYKIRCFYRETDITLTPEPMSVRPLNEESLELENPPPKCSYRIQRKDMNGDSSAGYFRVGEPVVHVFECQNADLMYRMLVKDCWVDDGKENRQQIINNEGCSLDETIMKTPDYKTNDSLLAIAEATVFKWPDEPSIYFSCQLSLCMMYEEDCIEITPPTCSERMKRSVEKAHLRSWSSMYEMYHFGGFAPTATPAANRRANHQFADSIVVTNQPIIAMTDYPTLAAIATTKTDWWSIVFGKTFTESSVAAAMINESKNGENLPELASTIVEVTVPSTRSFTPTPLRTSSTSATAARLEELLSTRSSQGTFLDDSDIEEDRKKHGNLRYSDADPSKDDSKIDLQAEQLMTTASVRAKNLKIMNFDLEVQHLIVLDMEQDLGYQSSKIPLANGNLENDIIKTFSPPAVTESETMESHQHSDGEEDTPKNSNMAAKTEMSPIPAAEINPDGSSATTTLTTVATQTHDSTLKSTVDKGNTTTAQMMEPLTFTAVSKTAAHNASMQGIGALETKANTIITPTATPINPTTHPTTTANPTTTTTNPTTTNPTTTSPTTATNPTAIASPTMTTTDPTTTTNPKTTNPTTATTTRPTTTTSPTTTASPTMTTTDPTTTNPTTATTTNPTTITTTTNPTTAETLETSYLLPSTAVWSNIETIVTAEPAFPTFNVTETRAPTKWRPAPAISIQRHNDFAQNKVLLHGGDINTRIRSFPAHTAYEQTDTSHNQSPDVKSKKIANDYHTKRKPMRPHSAPFAATGEPDLESLGDFPDHKTDHRASELFYSGERWIKKSQCFGSELIVGFAVAVTLLGVILFGLTIRFMAPYVKKKMLEQYLQDLEASPGPSPCPSSAPGPLIPQPVLPRTYFCPPAGNGTVGSQMDSTYAVCP